LVVQGDVKETAMRRGLDIADSYDIPIAKLLEAEYGRRWPIVAWSFAEFLESAV
jgi:hypothetical protein